MDDKSSGADESEKEVSVEVLQFSRGVLSDLEDLDRRFDAIASELDRLQSAGTLEALERMEVLHRKVRAARGRLMASAKDGGLWAAQGARSFNSWMTTRMGSDPSEVGRAVNDAAKLRDHLPLMAQAVADGHVSAGHVSAMVRNVLGTEKQREALKRPDVGEAFLVKQAKEQTVPKFRQLVKVWGHRADPDAGDSRWQEEASQEYLVLAKTLDGYHLQGFLSPLNGKTVAEAIRASIGVPPEGDTRTLQERNAHGLTEMANTVLASGVMLKSSVVRPQLSVTVEYETLQKLIARRGAGSESGVFGASAQAAFNGIDQSAFDLSGHAESDRSEQVVLDIENQPVLNDGTILTSGQLEFISCDSTVTRIVFGSESAVLDVGREKRVVTSQQRRAVEARDRHCQYPGCEAYSNTSEVHHVIHWANGGETSVANSVLLCRFHHQHVHMREISIKRRGDIWDFYTPHGLLINDRDQHVRYGLVPE